MKSVLSDMKSPVIPKMQELYNNYRDEKFGHRETMTRIRAQFNQVRLSDQDEWDLENTYLRSKGERI